MAPSPAKRVRERVVDPLTDFLHEESAGAVVLLAAAIVALVWANSPWGDSYADLWSSSLDLSIAGFDLDLDLRHWVDDGLMAVFFFVVGLEIKRELVTGELQDRRTAALPALAAAGGVALPAVIFVAITAGGEGAAGWAIPAATDIAFAVGVLALFGDRISSGTRLFLLAVAIVDDVIAITIIAFFYAGPLQWGWLAGAAAIFLAIVVLKRLGVSRIAVYVPLGVLAWLAVHESGVHATIAGVVLGLLTPAGPVNGREPLTTLENRLHPLSAFLIVPLFALANAGVDFGGDVLGDVLSNEVTWAVAVALVVGKLVGIAGATLLAVRAGWGTLPAGMARAQVWGVAALGGIGFTVSLFIAELAYDDTLLTDAAKVGIFIGSIVSGVLGGVLLARGRTAAEERG